MNQLGTSRCPNCGAAITAPVQTPMGAQCPYCGTTLPFFGAPPPQQPMQGFAPPQPTPMQSFGAQPQLIAQGPTGGRAGKLVIIMVVAVIGLGALGAVVPLVMFSSFDVGGSSPGGISRDRLAGDLEAMDAVQLIDQTRAVALRHNPQAQLTNVTIPQTVGGLINASRGYSGTFTYAWSYQDPSRPPGQDQVAGRVMVSIHDGEMRSVESPAIGLSHPPFSRPACSSQGAWNVAVQSGVPFNAVASLHLMDSSRSSPGSPQFWSFQVEGHDEYRRDIDATTCAMVRNWANN